MAGNRIVQPLIIETETGRALTFKQLDDETWQILIEDTAGAQYIDAQHYRMFNIGEEERDAIVRFLGGGFRSDY